jgi:hypothetical protein
MGLALLKLQRAYYLGKWLNEERRFMDILNFFRDGLLHKPILYD